MSGKRTSRSGAGDKIAALAGSSLFGGIDRSALQAVAAESHWLELQGGETLFQQGDGGDSLYLVVRGRLRVFIGAQGRERALAEIARGESVGEMAVLTGDLRSASVRAIRDSKLLQVSRDAFERLVETSPVAMVALASEVVSRLQRTNVGTGAGARLATVAVVPAGGTSSVLEFAERLTEALGLEGKSLRLNSQAVDAHFGPGTARSNSPRALADVEAWLEEVELAHHHLIYEADIGPSAWTNLCLRQADQVLFVAAAEADPDPNLVELALAANPTATLARRDLVLVHEDRELQYLGARRWLDRRQVRGHHHVHRQSFPDHARLARLIDGRAIGLVLGGGGARGFAHIGVIRALDEAGIPVDVIGGTSMGAVIAAQYALGWDHQTMLERNRKGFVESNPVSDRTLPLVALISGRRLEAMLRSMFGESQIEDLWLRYFCVSTNLTQAAQVVHGEGPLATWVRASMSVPGVAAPVLHQGDLLVDGGVLNNLPGDVMKTICGGPVIAVEVSPQRDLAVDAGLTAVPSGWRLLFDRLRPGVKAAALPSILAILNRSAMLASIHAAHEVRTSADLYMHPPVDRFGIFEWHSLEQIVDAGYTHAKEAIAAWQKSSPTASEPTPAERAPRT